MLKVGDPLENDTFVGPLISKEHQEKVQKYIQVARNEGAKVDTIQFELKEKNKSGFYVGPTIISHIREDSLCMKDEIFGPVVCIQSFTCEQEVVQKVNATEYGLCATIWSSSVDTIHRVANQLKVGTVWANCWLVRNLHMPFGGTKMSGNGREGTQDSREFYTEKKTICVKFDL